MSIIAITGRRTLTLESGKRQWTVSEFDGGRSYMLDTTMCGSQFTAHFDAEQWLEFVGLIVGGDRQS